MGTSGPPDMCDIYRFVSPPASAKPVPTARRTSPSPLLGPDEASRFAASAPKPDTRFHYRAIAADRALAAADLLPQRSQAYAATLCWAARYAIDSGDDEKATAIYKRYVATGAYQGWAKNFGRECVEPDFEAAKTFWQRRVTTWVKQMAGLAWRHSGLLAALVIAFVVIVFLGRRVMRARRTRSSLDRLLRAVGIDGAHDIVVGRRLIELPQEAQLNQRPGIEVDAQVDEGKAFAVRDHQAGRLDLFSSPPAASPASMARISRSASGSASLASKLCTMASTTSVLRRMLPAATQSRPTRPLNTE